MIRMYTRNTIQALLALESMLLDSAVGEDDGPSAVGEDDGPSDNPDFANDMLVLFQHSINIINEEYTMNSPYPNALPRSSSDFNKADSYDVEHTPLSGPQMYKFGCLG